ncbi:LamG-like jellyroll fold domain-containing protein [Mucilaginibacter rubeus]|uniref:Sialidase domain-containing protein n=1 Tax=Mucilaginibacter rubeus TaxID=2027860 RepID=A0A5C1HXP0_9SPHI|nr:LamG-like jellyroll fold domain-containing protein [Mucilaginibacter rubeus]QEM10425.1 hypothetical protein DEO27_010440 [Mucilaginibacter rubeus]
MFLIKETTNHFLIKVRYKISRRYILLCFAIIVNLLFGSCNKNNNIGTINPPSTTDTTGNSQNTNSDQEQKLRDITTGSTIYKSYYIDQPYIVQAQDSSWVCVFTTGTGQEGSPGQHVMATRSVDLGKTWSPAVDIEPATGPVASWVTPYITSYGRIYAFYNYNGDNIMTLKGVAIKNDLLGWYCYRYSDDMGATWSERYRIPIRNTNADLTNNFKGAVQMFWGICKPIKTTNGMYFSYTKIGAYMSGQGEGWVINCPNIETEKNASSLEWNLLPDGNVGIKNPAWNIQEEHNIVQLSNGTFYCVNRTLNGFPAFATSTDWGKTWTMPLPLRYGFGTSSDRIMKQPRACARIFKLKNGKYLLWYHNDNMSVYGGRNPGWISGGVELNGTIWWSEPEVLLYSKNRGDNMSYPDIVEQQNRYFITETQKSIARVHEINPAILNGVWSQQLLKTQVTNGLVWHQGEEATGTGIPANSKFPAQQKLFPVLNDGGFTIEFKVKLTSQGTQNTIFSNVDATGKGVSIVTNANNTISISLNDGRNTISWDTDQGLLANNATHDVAFVVDGQASLIIPVVDGKVCDGGAQREFGWTRFFNFVDVNSMAPIWLSKGSVQLSDVRVFSRALRISELVSNYQASNN